MQNTGFEIQEDVFYDVRIFVHLTLYCLTSSCNSPKSQSGVLKGLRLGWRFSLCLSRFLQPATPDCTTIIKVFPSLASYCIVLPSPCYLPWSRSQLPLFDWERERERAHCCRSTQLHLSSEKQLQQRQTDRSAIWHSVACPEVAAMHSRCVADYIAVADTHPLLKYLFSIRQRFLHSPLGCSCFSVAVF